MRFSFLFLSKSGNLFLNLPQSVHFFFIYVTYAEKHLRTYILAYFYAFNPVSRLNEQTFYYFIIFFNESGERAPVNNFGAWHEKLFRNYSLPNKLRQLREHSSTYLPRKLIPGAGAAK